MANDREIRILIAADGSAAISGIRSVGDETERFQGRTLTMTESLKKNWLGVTAGITGAYLALQKMWSWMEQAAELEERMETLNRLTRQYGMSAEDLTGVIQKNSRGLIGLADSAQVATDALMKGFTPQQVAQMASWSVTLHKTAAETMTSADAFRMLEQSITAARERGTVKLLGATIDLESAYGKAAQSMSKAEKAQAMFTLVGARMATVQKAIGNESDSAADRMQRFTNSINEMKMFLGQLLLLVGQPLMAVFNVILTLSYGVAGGIATIISYFTKLTDLLKLTHTQAPVWEKRAEAMYGKSAKQAEQALGNVKGTVDQLLALGTLPGGGGKMPALGGDLSENQKRLEQLNDLVRKYAEEREIVNAGELDRELVKLDYWFNEQRTKLKDLAAEDKHYNALVDTYTEKHQAARLARAVKIAEGERKVWEKNRADEIALEKEKAEAILSERERAIRQENEVRDAYGKVYGETESDRIRRRAAMERDLLEIQSLRVLGAITEEMTQEQILVVVERFAQLQKEITENKRVEAEQLDVRRVELQREITELSRQQEEILREGNLNRAQEALGKIGGSDLAGNMKSMADLSVGLEKPWEGQDAYSKEFQAWSALQDQKIQKMEEVNASEADIREAYRQYDLRQEATAQNQKLAMAGSTFGMMGGVAEAFYKASGNKSKEAFAVMKAMRIGETVINTFSASVAAYNALASIPYVGPALGAAAAVAAIAFGMAQVQAIASAEPGGRPSMSMPSTAMGVGTAGPTPEVTGPPPVESQQPIVNVHIYNSGYIGADADALARDLAPHIQKAYADGVAR